MYQLPAHFYLSFSVPDALPNSEAVQSAMSSPREFYRNGRGLGLLNESQTIKRAPRGANREQQSLPHHAVYPPSITRCAPVMNDEASLSRNNAAPLYSCGSDIRPSMFSLSHNARRSGSSSKFFRTIFGHNISQIRIKSTIANTHRRHDVSRTKYIDSYWLAVDNLTPLHC